MDIIRFLFKTFGYDDTVRRIQNKKTDCKRPILAQKCKIIFAGKLNIEKTRYE